MRMRCFLVYVTVWFGAAAACSTKEECLGLFGTSPVGFVASQFATLALDAHDWEHHSELSQTVDSQWCPNNTAYEFLPVPVANYSFVQSTATWSNTGCFASNTATVTFNSTGATITITGKTPKGLCADLFVVMTSYSIIVIEVSALRPTGTGVFKAWKPSELQDVKNSGLFFYVLPCGLEGTVASILNTVTLFDSNATTMLAANMAFLMQRGVWPTPTLPFGKDILLDKTIIKSGTYLAIARFDGLDPLIMYGTGGMTGHSALAVWDGPTLYICESTDKNPFGPVYWPPPYGVIRHEWDTWVQLAQQASYHVAVLPIQAQYGSVFDEAAYWAWWAGVQGGRYGYPTLVGSFLDVGPESENLPQPITANSITALLNFVDGIKPVNTSSDFGVSVYTLLTVGLNQRLGLNCSAFSCVIDQTVANAAAGLHPLNMLEAEAIPEQDSWRFQGNSSMVCSQLAAQGWKYGLQGAFPVWSSIAGNEQTPKDNYQTNLFDGAFFTDANCPGGVISPATGTGGFCQIMGAFQMPLNEYNTIPVYAGMNSKCPSQWPSYFRCPAGQPTCC